MSTEIRKWNKYVSDLYLKGRLKLQDVEIPSIYADLLDEKAVLLDLGCGDGRFSIAANPKTSRVVSVDVSLDGLLSLKQRVKTSEHHMIISPILSSAYYLPFRNETFTSCFFIYIIEHLSKPRTALHEIARVLGKNGQLILSTDNKIIYDVYQLLFRRIRHDPTHISLMFPFQVLKMLRERCFFIEKEIYSQDRVMKILHRLIPIFCYGMIFLARRR